MPTERPVMLEVPRFRTSTAEPWPKMPLRPPVPTVWMMLPPLLVTLPPASKRTP